MKTLTGLDIGIIIGFLAGALLAMAVITVKFLTDDRIWTGEDIAKVGNLPTLGMVPVQDLSENNLAEERAKHSGSRRKKTENKEEQQEEKKA